MFFNTQRLRPHTYAAAGRGIDKYFECEYMGSSEFEWGALPNALRSFRQSTNLGITSHSVTSAGATRVIYLVSDLATSTEIASELQVWVDARCPAQESARFLRRIVEGDNPADGETQCWWSISDNAAWAFDEQAAENFLAGLLDTTKAS